jgi:hypothetical protein
MRLGLPAGAITPGTAGVFSQPPTPAASPTGTRLYSNWLGTSQGLEALAAPPTDLDPANQQHPSPIGAGPLPYWGGQRYYRNSVISWQEAWTQLANDRRFGGQYGVALYTINSQGLGGVVPQPMIVSRRAYLPRVGLVAVSQNRQPFPPNRIAYTGVAPNAIFPTVGKPYPWAAPPYVAPFLTPSAPGGASG